MNKKSFSSESFLLSTGLFSTLLFIILFFALPYSKIDSMDLNQEEKKQSDHIFAKPKGYKKSYSSYMLEKEKYKWVVKGAFTYYHPEVLGTQYAYKKQGGGAAIPTISNTLKNNLHFYPGFSLCIGRSIYHSDWKALLKFDMLHASNKTEEGVYNEVIVPLNGASLINVSVHHSSSLLQIKYDNLSLSITKDFHLNENLLITALTGLDQSWFRIKQLSYFRNGDLNNFQATIKNDCHYSGLGPLLGTTGKWMLAHTIYAKSSLSVAYDYSQFRLLYDETNEKEGGQYLKINDHFHQFVPQTSFYIGIGFEEEYEEENLFLQASLGFKGKYFWDQFQFYKISSKGPPPLYFLEKTDLSFHGLELNFSVNF